MLSGVFRLPDDAKASYFRRALPLDAVRARCVELAVGVEENYVEMKADRRRRADGSRQNWRRGSPPRAAAQHHSPNIMIAFECNHSAYAGQRSELEALTPAARSIRIDLAVRRRCPPRKN